MQDIYGFIDRSKRRYAYTYRRFAPHRYLVKDKLSEEDQKIFLAFVMFIRENGYDKPFGKRNFTYFDIGKYMYWSMGEPLEDTTILNRALIREIK